MARRPSRAVLRRVSEVISRHHRFVYRLAFRCLGNRADAEDVTQSVFLKLVRSPASLDAVTSERAWLAQVTVNCARSWVRSEERRRAREQTWVARRLRQGQEVERSEDEAMRTNDAVSEAISSLPDELRVPVILYYQEGFKYREIAEACGCPEGTVARRLSRARERLREKLGACGALAALPSLEAALGVECPIECPAGLEAALVRGVEREILGVAGQGGIASGLAAGSVVSGAALLKLGLAFLLSGALTGGAWMAMDRLATREEVTAEVPAPAAKRKPARYRRRSAAGASLRSAVRERGPVASRSDSGAPDGGEALAVAAETPPGAAVVRGRVTDVRGEPLAGARVALTGGDVDAELATVETDAEGYYEIAMPQGHGDITSYALGALNAVAFSPDGEMLAAGEAVYTLPDSAEWVRQVSLDFTGLPPPEEAAAATEWVVSTGTEEVEANFDLYVANRLEAELQQEIEAVTQRIEVARSYEALVDASLAMGAESSDATTRLWVGRNSPGPHRIVVRLEGHEVAVSDELTVEEGETVELDFELEDARLVAGSVFSDSGRPLAGAAVTVVAHTVGVALPAAAGRVETHEDGRFELPSLPEGLYALRVESPGFLPVERIVRPGDSRLVFQLPSAGTVSVTVVRDETGEPISSYLVELRDGDRVVKSRETDGAGAVRFDPVPPGVYLLNTHRSTSRSRYSRARLAIDVPAGTDLEIELGIDERVAVSGRVLSAYGDALPSGLLALAVPDDGIRYPLRNVRAGEVGADGMFDLGGLPPGSYLLALARPEARAEPLALLVFDLFTGEPAVALEAPLGEAPAGLLELWREITGTAGPEAPASRSPPGAGEHAGAIELAFLDGGGVITVRGRVRLATIIDLAAGTGALALPVALDPATPADVLEREVELASSARAGEVVAAALEAAGLHGAVRGGVLELRAR